MTVMQRIKSGFIFGIYSLRLIPFLFVGYLLYMYLDPSARFSQQPSTCLFSNLVCHPIRWRISTQNRITMSAELTQYDSMLPSKQS